LIQKHSIFGPSTSGMLKLFSSCLPNGIKNMFIVYTPYCYNYQMLYLGQSSRFPCCQQHTTILHSNKLRINQYTLHRFPFELINTIIYLVYSFGCTLTLQKCIFVDFLECISFNVWINFFRTSYGQSNFD